MSIQSVRYVNMNILYFQIFKFCEQTPTVTHDEATSLYDTLAMGSKPIVPLAYSRRVDFKIDDQLL